jgi:predicted nucleotidyltransferase
MPDEDALPVTSSQEPEWAPEAQSCYRGVIRNLLEAGVPFAVSGGFAFHHHTGIWRTTKDLDLVLTPGAVPEAFRVLVEEGFETYVQDPVWLAKARRGDYFVDLITGVGNATLTVEQSWIDRATQERVLGIQCKVLRVEEMIASKLFVTRRERFDGADIAHLLRARARGLDWDRLRGLTAAHWQMLYWYLLLFAYIYPSHIEDVPEFVWRNLHQSFEELLMNSSQLQPFRGSLIDPKMFAIDVDEWGERDLYREYWENYPHPLKEINTTRSRE